MSTIPEASMSDTPDDLDRQIRELEADRATVRSERARAAIDEELAALRGRRTTLVNLAGAQTGDTTFGDIAGGSIDKRTGTVEARDSSRVSQAIGVNYGVVQAFFGAGPPADAEQQLRAYLDRLCERYSPLALGRLLTRERTGGEGAAAPPLPLRSVYTALATDGRVRREPFDLTAEALDKALAEADPDRLPPDRLRFPVADLDELRAVAAAMGPGRPGAEARSLRELFGSLRRATPRAAGAKKTQRVAGHWYEPELAVEALAPPRARVVLLGDPGSGKSTVLRYLVVCIAEALLAGATSGPDDLRGWAGLKLPVPIFCALGPVAKRLDDDPIKDLGRLEAAVLQAVFRDESPLAGARDALFRAWGAGGVLLCLDGLDEVSGAEEPTLAGPLSRRARLAEAIRQLAQELGDSRVVVTCRTRPYEQDAAWQLPNPWQVRRIEPFAFGQVRFFVETWYAQSCAAPGAKFAPEEGAAKAAELLRAIPAKPGLRDICVSPLLLTMVVLLHFNQKQLPDERAEVYEELVGLLLDRWEWVRSSDRGPARLVPFGERLGLPQLRARDLRAALNEVAYQAHRGARDGRGVIPADLVYKLLEPRFRLALDPDRPDRVKKHAWTAKVETFLELLVDESGLVQPDADGAYVLPHLTFEEYLAACYLADQQSRGLRLAHERWAEGGDRWREPLLLLMGCLRRENKHEEAKAWLDLLLDPVVGTEEKAQGQRQRDAALAAACYADLGDRRYLLGYQHHTKVDELEARLRAALLNTVERPDVATLLPLRVEAGHALGRLGDPRYPVALDEWRGRCRAELVAPPQGLFTADPTAYWRYVPPGTYRIGGWDEGTEDSTAELPGFWVARLPLTVVQFAPFVPAGYGRAAEGFWTPEGRKWKGGRAQPDLWDNARVNSPSQPVVGVSWYEAVAYAAWLGAQLAAALPEGYVLRLPAEAEWEAAAAYAGPGARRDFPWGNAPEPTLELAVYDEARLGAAAPVGCCPAGAAACGALDLAGNVWEWTMGSHRAYPGGGAQEDFTPDDSDVAVRGGSWIQSSSYVRCGARVRPHPVYVILSDGRGFRVCVAPRSHKSS